MSYILPWFALEAQIPHLIFIFFLEKEARVGVYFLFYF